jgi:hypothetical protein
MAVSPSNAVMLCGALAGLGNLHVVEHLQRVRIDGDQQRVWRAQKSIDLRLAHLSSRVDESEASKSESGYCHAMSLIR